MSRVDRILKTAATIAPLLGPIGNAEAQQGWNATVAVSDQYSEPAMKTFGFAEPPQAFRDFCMRAAAECIKQDQSQREQMKRREGSEFDMLELSEVNTHVHDTVKQVSDLEQHGVEDRWDVAGIAGDCEDHALLKRQMLINKGWQHKDLLITILFLKNNEGHAVLTVRTEKGDFILDNLRREIVPWGETVKRFGYRYVMRQGYIDPQQWMALDPRYTRK